MSMKAAVAGATSRRSQHLCKWRCYCLQSVSQRARGRGADVGGRRICGNSRWPRVYPSGAKISVSPETEPSQAFSIRAAGVMATTMAIMLIIAAGLKDRFGETGILIGAALAGFIDTHSAAISVASLTTVGKITPSQAVFPILAAMSCNAMAKGAMAIGAGSHGFALRIVPGLALSMATAWAVAIAMLLRA